MRRKFTVVLLALVAALLLGLSVFFVACDVGTENEEQSGHTHTMTYIAAEEATCTEEGNVAYWHCSGCGKNFSDEAGENELTSVTVPAKNHSFGEWVDNEDGETHTRTCSACTATETENHAFGAWVDNENGTHTRTCSVCSATETEDHTFSAWEDKENGTHTRTCACGAAETVDHSFGTWEDDDNGTTHTHTCACGATETVAHSFGDWADDDSGTTHTRTCVCGATETESHAFGAWVDTGDGTHIHNCLDCDANETAAHVFDEETNSYCTVCDFISDYTQGLAYSYADGSYTVTGIGTVTASKIIIPATYNDGVNGSAAVTGIGSSVFEGRSSLTEVTIPVSVTSIGSRAFFYCRNLTKINYNAAAVADLTSDSNVFYNAGSDSDGITVIFGESVTSIPAYLFDVNVSSSYAPNLVSVTIGNNVESIGPYAFSGCSSLTDVYISDLVAWCAISFGDGSANPLRYADNMYLNGELVTVFVIPEEVTSIGPFAFYGCSGLTEITIPASVTSIGSSAFYGCSGLTEITIPASVTSISSFAFYGCSGLTEITIPASVTSIGSSAFSGCSGLTEINYNAATVADLTSSSRVFYGAGSHSDGIAVIFGESVTSIPAYLFYVNGSSSYAPNLVSVTIGSNVESIGSSAFYGCSNLTKINYNAAAVADLTRSSNVFYNAGSNSDGITVIFGESVKSIPAYLFYGSRHLISVTIGSNVESIGLYAFRGCSNLAEINYNAAAVADLTSDSNVFYNVGSNSEGCTVTFGESVTSIPACLFRYANITSVMIGSNVESIGNSAFFGCSRLSGVYIIDLAAWCAMEFEGYYANPLYYAGNLYLDDELVTELVISEGVTSISSSAFYNCDSLTSVTIGAGVTSIGSSAFSGCSNLTEITIPEGVTSIGSSAFRGCSSLTEINYNAAAVADLTSSSRVFYGAGSNSDGITVTFGESVKSIPAYLFYAIVSSSDVLNLVSVTIGSNVESIGNGAFYGCRSLAEITIPDSVTSIGSSAFYGCSSLTEITIPVGVTSIGSSAFYDCIKLIEVFNQSALDITVGSGKNGYIAYYAKNVYTQVEGGSWFTDTAEGYRFFYDGNKGYLMGYSGTGTALTLPVGFTAYDETEMTEYEIYSYAFYGRNDLTSVTIPASVTSIGSYAFQSCSGLLEITIPEGVTSIGSSAFRGCSSLTEITIPEGVTSIGLSAFRGCSSLTEITIPEGVTSIGSYAFAYCSSLTEITIPDSVTSIGEYAFRGCSSLTEITLPASVTSIGEDAFRDCSSLTGVYINDLAAWCAIMFGNSVANPLYYAGDLYLNGELVTELVIPEGVVSIGSVAFYGCNSLTEITIPASVTSINSYAFAYCSSLAKITIEEGVTSIGSYAFCDCSSLTGVYISNIAAWCAISFGDDTANPLRYAGNLYLKGELVTEIVIPEGVTSIGSYAFYYCSILTEITIPASVTGIGDNAFYNCYKLIEVYNQSALDITAGSDENGYVAYYAQHVYTQEEGGSWFTDTAEGYRFYYDGNKGYLMGYSGTETALTLPAEFTAYDGTEVTEYEIYAYAFCNRNDLMAVTISDSVTGIGRSAFWGCGNLTEITLSASVTSIDEFVFAYCSGLTEITIPDSVTSIGSYAFYNCSNLTSVTFENTEGWWYASSSGATSGTEIASSDLADPSTAATYLKSRYDNYYWHRS